MRLQQHQGKQWSLSGRYLRWPIQASEYTRRGIARVIKDSLDLSSHAILRGKHRSTHLRSLTYRRRRRTLGRAIFPIPNPKKLWYIPEEWLPLEELPNTSLKQGLFSTWKFSGCCSINPCISTISPGTVNLPTIHDQAGSNSRSKPFSEAKTHIRITEREYNTVQ